MVMSKISDPQLDPSLSYDLIPFNMTSGIQGRPRKCLSPESGSFAVRRMELVTQSEISQKEKSTTH